MRRILFAGGLVLIWALAWGSLSPANLLSGLAMTGFLFVLAPEMWPRRDRVVIRPRALVALAWHLAGTIVRSNVVLTRLVVARRPCARSGVIGVEIPPLADGTITFVTNAMALTPGMIPLEVRSAHDDPDAPLVMFLHVLDLQDVEEARREVLRLVALAERAFGARV